MQARGGSHVERILAKNLRTVRPVFTAGYCLNSFLRTSLLDSGRNSECVEQVRRTVLASENYEVATLPLKTASSESHEKTCSNSFFWSAKAFSPSILCCSFINPSRRASGRGGQPLT